MKKAKPEPINSIYGYMVANPAGILLTSTLSSSRRHAIEKHVLGRGGLYRTTVRALWRQAKREGYRTTPVTIIPEVWHG